MGFFIKLIQQKGPPKPPLSSPRSSVPLSASRPSAMKTHNEPSDPQPIERSPSLFLSPSLLPSLTPPFSPLDILDYLVGVSESFFPIKHSEIHGPDKTLELKGDSCHSRPQSHRAKELPEVRLEGRG